MLLRLRALPKRMDVFTDNVCSSLLLTNTKAVNHFNSWQKLKKIKLQSSFPKKLIQTNQSPGFASNSHLFSSPLLQLSYGAHWTGRAALRFCLATRPQEIRQLPNDMNFTETKKRSGNKNQHQAWGSLYYKLTKMDVKK